MIHRHYRVDVLILSRKNTKEADRIVTVFSKQLGKLRLVAKGVRKPSSRKRGSLEVFTFAKLQVAGTPGLGIVTEAQILDSFSPWRKNLRRVAVAYHWAEVVEKLTREGERQEGVFANLLYGLRSLKKRRISLRSLRKEVDRNLLVALGFWNAKVNLPEPNKVIEQITEEKLGSVRVGKYLVS